MMREKEGIYNYIYPDQQIDVTNEKFMKAIPDNIFDEIELEDVDKSLTNINSKFVKYLHRILVKNGKLHGTGKGRFIKKEPNKPRTPYELNIYSEKELAELKENMFRIVINDKGVISFYKI